MKYKHIEASREVRLWLKTITEVGILGAFIWSNKELRDKVTEKFDAGKNKLKKVINRL